MNKKIKGLKRKRHPKYPMLMELTEKEKTDLLNHFAAVAIAKSKVKNG